MPLEERGFRQGLQETIEAMSSKEKISLQQIYSDYATFLNRQAPGDLIFNEYPFPKRFYVHEVEPGEFEILEELPGKVLRYVKPGAVTAALVQYSATLPYEMKDYFLEAGRADKVTYHWKHHTPTFPHKIHPVLQKHTDGYTFHRLDFDMKDIPTPLFDTFLDHMETNKDAFLAFNGMLFDPDAPRQQYLWLRGEGEDGKGTWCRFLKRIFDNSFVALSSDARNVDKFFTSRLIGRRVGVFQDCQNPNIVKSEAFMMITGGDPVFVEKKGRDGYTIEIPTLVVVSSNEFPNITGAKSDRRRAVIVSLRERSKEHFIPNYEELFWKEREGILYKCWQAWLLCKKEAGGRIIPDQDVIQDVVDTTEAKFTALTDRYFDITGVETDRVGANEFFMLLHKEERLSPWEIGKFAQYLKRRHGVNKICGQHGDQDRRKYTKIRIKGQYQSIERDNTPAKF